jgi:hypothetical protein
VPYEWAGIEQNWLDGDGSGLAPSADEVLHGFNNVEALLGREWVEASRTSGGGARRGNAPTLEVVALGRMLQALDGVPNTETLLEKIRNREQDARAELMAVYLMRTDNPNPVVELEPEVRVGTGYRKPDFRTRINDEPWTYVEVTNPNTSAAQQEVLQNIEKLTSLVNGCAGSFALEVFLKRDASTEELDLIAELIMQVHQTAGQSADELPDGVGTMYWNYHQPGMIILDDHGEAYTPRLAKASAIIGAEERRHIIVRWPFTDTRAEAFMTSEARQLSTDAPGMIMIYTSGNIGAMKAWRALIERRLQPNIHTRVSAVCLYSSGFRSTDNGDDWLIACKLIPNPHARNPLPRWISEQLGRFPSDEADI